jgi:hypothetical protein
MTITKTYPLRLPRSVREAVNKIAEVEGVSVNQFIATAVAEKLAALNTARFSRKEYRAPISPHSGASWPAKVERRPGRGMNCRSRGAI